MLAFLKRRWFLLSCAVVLSGCATNSRDPLASRRDVFEKRLSSVEPGATRRELYALLPPSRTPIATPPSLASIFGGSIQYAPLTERHPLDNDFSVLVAYRLADLSEYPPPPFAPGRRHNPSIDDLILRRAQTESVRSRQNPNDELVCRPKLVRAGWYFPLGFTLAGPYEALKVSKPKRK